MSPMMEVIFCGSHQCSVNSSYTEIEKKSFLFEFGFCGFFLGGGGSLFAMSLNLAPINIPG